MAPRFILAMLVGAAVSAGASAQSITPPAFDFGSLPVGAPNFPIEFTLPTFDSNLGTLTSVALTLNGNINASLDIFNETGANQTVTNPTASEAISVTGPAGTTVTVTPAITVASATVTPGSNILAAQTAAAVSSAMPGDLSDYETAGTGSFSASINAGGLGTYSGTGPAGVFFGGSADAGGSVSVTYTYTATAIPEPATCAVLLGAAAMGLAAYRRRQVGQGATGTGYPQ